MGNQNQSRDSNGLIEHERLGLIQIIPNRHRKNKQD